MFVSGRTHDFFVELVEFVEFVAFADLSVFGRSTSRIKVMRRIGIVGRVTLAQPGVEVVGGGVGSVIKIVIKIVVKMRNDTHDGGLREPDVDALGDLEHDRVGLDLDDDSVDAGRGHGPHAGPDRIFKSQRVLAPTVRLNLREHDHDNDEYEQQVKRHEIGALPKDSRAIRVATLLNQHSAVGGWRSDLVAGYARPPPP